MDRYKRASESEASKTLLVVTDLCKIWRMLKVSLVLCRTAVSQRNWLDPTVLLGARGFNVHDFAFFRQIYVAQSGDF